MITDWIASTRSYDHSNLIFLFCVHLFCRVPKSDFADTNRYVLNFIFDLFSFIWYFFGSTFVFIVGVSAFLFFFLVLFFVFFFPFSVFIHFILFLLILSFCFLRFCFVFLIFFLFRYVLDQFKSLHRLHFFGTMWMTHYYTWNIQLLINK